MPFESQAQRAWMYANHPDMAKEWEAHTPKDEKLPKRKRRRRKRGRRSKSMSLALWANDIQRRCLMEAGDDVDAGLAAAEIILSTETMPEGFSIPLATTEQTPVKSSKPKLQQIEQSTSNSEAPQVATDSDREFTTHFTADNKKFFFHARPHKLGGWHVTFGKHDDTLTQGVKTANPYELTNDPDVSPFKVLRGVHHSFNQFVERRKPDTVWFSANNKDKSRVHFYDHIAPLLAKKHGYTLTNPDASAVHAQVFGAGNTATEGSGLTHYRLDRPPRSIWSRIRGKLRLSVEDDTIPPVEHQHLVHSAVAKHAGSTNMAPLVKVRKHLADNGMSREHQDAAIHHLRKQGVLTAIGIEGRHGITQEERDAAIKEGKNLHGYLGFRPGMKHKTYLSLSTQDTPEKNGTEQQPHTKTIEEFEHPDSESWSLPVEHVVLRDAKGNHTHYAGNSAKEVTLPQEHRHLLKDSVYTHNHPTGTNVLSVSDVNTAVHHNVAEMRAIAHNRNDNKRYTMSLKRPESGWHPNMVTEYNQAKDKILREATYSPTMHRQIADKMHLALGALANKYGAIYERRLVQAQTPQANLSVEVPPELLDWTDEDAASSEDTVAPG